MFLLPYLDQPRHHFPKDFALSSKAQLARQKRERIRNILTLKGINSSKQRQDLKNNYEGENKHKSHAQCHPNFEESV